MKWNIKQLLACMIIIFNLEFITSHNASECVKMFFNNTITTPCINNMTCCYLEYSNFNANATSKKCLLKKNDTENICPQLGPAVSYFYSSLDICDCMGHYLKTKTLLMILIVVFLN